MTESVEPLSVAVARMEGKLDTSLARQADLGRRVGATEQDIARSNERAQLQAVTLAETSGRVSGLRDEQQRLRDENNRLRAALEALPGTARQNLVAVVAVAGLALSLIEGVLR